MRFYTKQHKYYCGIDLHTKKMFVCIIEYLDRLTNKHGKGKASSILAHKLGRAVYFMLKNKEAFSQKKFLGL